ncbi:MAG: aspartate kinase [Candidatus Hydrogenedentota bacterium]
MLFVQKFGGSSVANVERIQNVARRVAKAASAGNQVVVIVSAMGDTTDDLIDLVKKLSDRPPEREYDVLLSTGEIVSAALLATALQAMGHKAVSMTGTQIGIRTDGVYTKAKIVDIDASRIRKELDKGFIVTVAGFQGMDERGDITTLGRGGSDTTAVALAAALKADVCEIFTDVDGVYTADPRIVPAAQKLPAIAYDEMLELATAGARVMQSRSIEFGAKFGVRIHVRSSFHEGEGTMIQSSGAGMEQVLIRGVAHDTEEAKITVTDVPDRPGIAAEIFGALADARISVDVIVQTATENDTNDISFTVGKADLSRALDIVKAATKKIGGGDVAADENIAKVSIVGVAMAQHSGVAATMFRTLAAEKINIQMITTSEIRISVIIDKARVADAARALHTAFGLDKR